MSYTCLLEQGEESSVECFSDIPAYVLSRLNLTEGKSCSKDNGTESCQSSPSGMTCGPSTEHRGQDSLMSSAQDFHVNGTPTLESSTAARGSMDGLTRFASLVKFSRRLYGWRTSQLSLLDTSGELPGTWPSWGMTQSGECFPLAPLVPHTHERGCSAWRTPAASDRKRMNVDWPSVRKGGNPLSLPQQIAQRGYHGYLNPQFQTALMNWPDGWTRLEPLGMDKFHKWLDSHGKH